MYCYIYALSRRGDFMFLLLLADKHTNKQTSQREKKHLLRDTSDSVPWEIHEISSMIICVFFSQFSKLSNKAVPYTFS